MTIPEFFSNLFDINFKKFLTISVVKFLYAFLIFVAALASIGFLIAGFSKGFGSGVVSLILCPILFVLYVLGARMWLELILVIFRIAENTDKMVGQNTQNADTTE